MTLFVGLGGGAVAVASEPVRLETAWMGEHETFLVWYAKEKGWDREAGLDFVLRRYATGREMESGAGTTWKIAGMGAVPVLRSDLLSRAYVVGIGNDESSANAVMVRRDDPVMGIKGRNPDYPDVYGHPDTIRGKTVLCPEASSAHYLLTRWLSVYGLSESDVNVVSHDPAVIQETVADGEADAVVLWAPYTYVAEGAGMRVAGNSRTVGARQPILLVADKEYADAHPDRVAAFLQVYMRAVRMMRDESVANLAAEYKRFYKEWTGKALSDAQVVKDITVHPVFTLQEQRALFHADAGKLSRVQQWLVDIFEFHRGTSRGQGDSTQSMRFSHVTGRYLDMVEDIAEYH
jgi:NitT/TauT family transport system substrate-binding protein/sulfonate transport system substrate-binding protein